MGKRARLPSASAIHDGSIDEILTLTVPAFLKRVGMEMRHLIGVTNSSLDRKPDRSLTRIIAQAYRFRDLLVRSNGRPFAEMADACGVTTSYFTRIVRFGFLEPGILEAAVSGLQPIDLKAQKLSLLPTLPIEWQAQRRELGFG
jgi:hypothetical protein